METIFGHNENFLVLFFNFLNVSKYHLVVYYKTNLIAPYLSSVKYVLMDSGMRSSLKFKKKSNELRDLMASTLKTFINS